MKTQSPNFEPVPHRVGVAYVSIRVNSQSTAQSVVQEVLPLLGRQVCTLSIPTQLWCHLPNGQATTVPLNVLWIWGFCPRPNVLPMLYRLRIRRDSS